MEIRSGTSPLVSKVRDNGLELQSKIFWAMFSFGSLLLDQESSSPCSAERTLKKREKMLTAFGWTCKIRTRKAYTCHRIPGRRYVLESKGVGGGGSMKVCWECDLWRVGQ